MPITRSFLALILIACLAACGERPPVDHSQLFEPDPDLIASGSSQIDSVDVVTLDDSDLIPAYNDDLDYEMFEAFLPAQLNITIEDFSVGNNGISIPGIPGWVTLKKTKNLALCVTTQVGQTDCYPSAALTRSRCPKTERCTYETVGTGGEPFVATVLNINNLGKGLITKALRFQCAGAFFFNANKCDDMKGYVAEANNKRVFWQGSFILSHQELDRSERIELEALARDAVMARVFPNSENPETGPLSAPFEVCLGDVDLGWACDPLREISVSAEFKE